jgi:hypothetical protein
MKTEKGTLKAKAQEAAGNPSGQTGLAAIGYLCLTGGYQMVTTAPTVETQAIGFGLMALGVVILYMKYKLQIPDQ